MFSSEQTLSQAEPTSSQLSHPASELGKQPPFHPFTLTNTAGYSCSSNRGMNYWRTTWREVSRTSFPMHNHEGLTIFLYMIKRYFLRSTSVFPSLVPSAISEKNKKCLVGRCEEDASLGGGQDGIKTRWNAHTNWSTWNSVWMQGSTVRAVKQWHRLPRDIVGSVLEAFKIWLCMILGVWL